MESKRRHPKSKKRASAVPPHPPPPPAPMAKVDDAMLTLAGHHAMFQPVADLLSWTDLECPALTYPTLLDAWKTQAEDTIGEALRATEVALTQKEETSFDIVKGIGFAAFEKFLAAARNVGWATQPVAARRKAVEVLLERPQIPQRTSEWYAQGKQVLTASEFATLYKSPRAVAQLAHAKVLPLEPIDASATTQRLACMTCEMGPFDWGIRFEPVVKQVLAAREGVVLAEAGRLLHPTDSLLAASPDGLILEARDPARVGRLVEIKCPLTRRVGEGIPFEYWCQMQIQMEVTGIGECEYIEVKIQSLQPQSLEWPAEGQAADGFIYLFQNPTTTKMVYAYTEAEKGECSARGWDLLETIPWRVETFIREIVARDRSWYEGTANLRNEFWEAVAQARAGTLQIPESSRAARGGGGGVKGLQVTVHKEEGLPIPTACLIQDDE